MRTGAGRTEKIAPAGKWKGVAREGRVPNPKVGLSLGGYAGQRLVRFLRYVDAVLHAELALDGLHLVLEAQFQLLETDLFQLLVFAEVSFLGE
jgi:hypothetical protein